MSDTTQAIATLRAYAVSCHDEIAQAGAHLCDAYERILALWTEQTAQRVRLEAEVGWLRAQNSAYASATSSTAVYRHSEVIWLRTRATDSQIGAMLKQRDDALQTVRIQAEEIAHLRAIIVAAVQVSAERGEQGA